MNILDEQTKAAQALELKDNQFFKDIIQSINDGLVSKLSSVGMNDRDTQQAITLSFQLLKQIESHIEVACQASKVTEFNLKQKDSILKRVRNVI